ncbi:hypothetical protein [Pseudonocardia acidicola]|uniref:DUF3040 family protein n=1 Tax=Pseudonocardia acidicola TaxID=2724939 RepID=A0ABX1SJU0_9PSEU|nr:hypothetical protein [Pseudonocardia acidicola]NMI00798.1 hypothetical protein [Pseudonocardia acidicola]
MSSMNDPEQRLAEALRARASQAGWAAAAAPPPHQAAGVRPAGSRVARTGGTHPRPEPSRSPRAQVGWALLVAFLAGAVLGCAIALLSVLAPGVLPPLG